MNQPTRAEHVTLLKQDVTAWNAWRAENPNIRPNLNKANLGGRNLGGANLSRANLRYAKLGGANLRSANLSQSTLSGASLAEANLLDANLSGATLVDSHLSMANLRRANLGRANLRGAILSLAKLGEANLSEANLSRAFLGRANFTGANLTGADLRFAFLGRANFTGANLTGASLEGASAKQQNLVITGIKGEPIVTVDNIEVAQFLYLLLHNQKIRTVIDTITSKAVLILGRFTNERKAVLDGLREELRKRNYLPILFDFERPARRDTTETISLLAGMARFVVADITNAKSVPQELQIIVPNLPSVPVQPLLLAGSDEYGMFEHFKRYPWVLKTHTYPSSEQLIADLGECVIRPAENYRRQAEHR